jgi:hypothetical protein
MPFGERQLLDISDSDRASARQFAEDGHNSPRYTFFTSGNQLIEIDPGFCAPDANGCRWRKHPRVVVVVVQRIIQFHHFFFESSQKCMARVFFWFLHLVSSLPSSCASHVLRFGSLDFAAVAVALPRMESVVRVISSILNKEMVTQERRSSS